MKKIVLVEDEEILRDLLFRKLQKYGYSVDVAVDGEEGIAKIKDTKPDLVLLDIVMPKKDGFGVMEEMKEDELIKDIPVIIVSNSGQPVELERAKNLGVKDWIIKTEFDPMEVVSMVNNYFDNN
jgi:CheY-like chemotaxis protein